MLSWENAAKSVPGGQRVGEWLRWQRQARAWSRAEMARRLIKAARARDDTSPDEFGAGQAEQAGDLSGFRPAKWRCSTWWPGPWGCGGSSGGR
jgi:hypothetical protein